MIIGRGSGMARERSRDLTGRQKRLLVRPPASEEMARVPAMAAPYPPSTHAILAFMPGARRARLQLLIGPLVVAAALGAAACSGGAAPGQATSTTGPAAGSTAATTTTTTTAPPAATSPLPSSGPLQVGAAVAIPFSADRVTAAESPDGAVFVSPQDPVGNAPTIVWVVDPTGPAAIAEHMPGGVAALAADGTNLYVASYGAVVAFDRSTGNQDAQWSLPPVNAANASDDGLVSLAAAGGAVLVSVTQGDTVSVYRIDPSSSAPPKRIVQGLGDAVGPDGSVYYETGDHHLAVRRPDGTTTTGPVLAHAPNGLGGGVQYVSAVAGGGVWVSEPAGQGLDAQFTTFGTANLAQLASFGGSVTNTVADTAAGPLLLVAAGASSECPQAAPTNPTSCVFRTGLDGAVSDPVGVGAAVTLIGPAPAVVASDTTTDQFDLFRLS
jgi:hypothetical protein